MDDELVCALSTGMLCGLGPTVAALVAWAVTARRLRALARRVEALEEQRAFAASWAPPAIAPAPEPAPLPPPAEEAPAPSEAPAEVEEPPVEPEPVAPRWTPPSPERLAVWVAAGLGGFLLVLAAILALVAAAERGWVGPVVRVAGGLVGGTALWAVGSRARRRVPWAGQALAGAGIGTLYGTLYAASGKYHLLPSTLAAGLMILVTAVGTARAARAGDRFLAWLALLGGVLTPVLVSTGENRPAQLFAYLVLLAAGVLVAAVRRGWWDLVAGAALGAGALHVGWTATWYQPDQVPIALLGAGALALPFALAARVADRSVRRAAIGSAVGLALLAAPWVVPVDPVFRDPRSGLEIVRTDPLALPAVALAVGLLPVPLLLVGRRWTEAAWAALAPACVLPLLAVASWPLALDPAPGWLALAAVGPLVLGALATAGSARAARPLALLVAASGGFVLVASPGLDGLPFAAAVLALVGAAVAIGATTRDGAVPAAGVAATALVSVGAAGLAQATALRFVVGPALVALAAFGHLAARVRWDGRARAAWIAAALAGLAVFPVLHRAWTLALSDRAIGLLPLLLAADALLVAVVVARRERLDRRDVVLAVQALVVLLGVTAAVPLQLRERWLTVAWALEALALAGISRHLRHPLIRWTSVALCLAVGVRLLVNPWALAWGTASEGWPILNWTLYTWGVPAVCIGLCARWLPDGRAEDPLRHLRLPLGVLALLVGFALVNVEVSHAFQDAGPLELTGRSRLQSMVRSASWAGYGLAVLGGGLFADARAIRLTGFAFVLLATLKVFTVDLWDLTGFVRVGSVGCLAVALVVAAFLFERLVLRGARPAVEER